MFFVFNASQRLNQAVKTHSYCAVCHKRIRGACTVWVKKKSPL